MDNEKIPQNNGESKINKCDRLIMKVPFFQVSNSIFDDEHDLSTLDIAVYCYLARCGNQGAVAFPSLPTIGFKCKMSRSSAAESINSLVKHGFLRKKTIPGIGCEYEILYNSEPVQQADGTRPAGGPVTRPAGGPKKELSFKKNYKKDFKGVLEEPPAPPEPLHIENHEEPENLKTCSEGKSELNQLIGHYIELFKNETGSEPFITPGKDHKLMNTVLKNRGFDEAKKLLELYFKTADDFTADKVGYSIGFFVKNINSLIAKGENPGMRKNVRDALNLAAKYKKEEFKPIEHYTYQEKLDAGLLDDSEISQVRDEGREHLQTIKTGLITADCQ